MLVRSYFKEHKYFVSNMNKVPNYIISFTIIVSARVCRSIFRVDCLFFKNLLSNEVLHLEAA